MALRNHEGDLLSEGHSFITMPLKYAHDSQKIIDLNQKREPQVRRGLVGAMSWRAVNAKEHRHDRFEISDGGFVHWAHNDVRRGRKELRDKRAS
jgi:hypothetical protein